MKYRFYPEKSEKEVETKHLRGFYKFIYDRHAIWHRRFVLKKKPPWTKDPILVKYKYTNIYRCLDRGTQFLHSRFLNEIPNEELGKNITIELLWEICVYRLLNKVETFDKIHIPSWWQFANDNERDRWFGLIQEMLDNGEKVWTDAHITLQSNLKANRLENYIHILGRLHPRIRKLRTLIFKCDSIENAFKILIKEYGFGPFITYEVITDLAYLEHTRFDINDWANPGPGCKVGLNFIFPKLKTIGEYQEKMFWLRDNQEKAFVTLGLSFKRIRYKGLWLDLRNVEHSLCEFGKYVRQGLGTGRARPLFRLKSENTVYDNM